MRGHRRLSRAALLLLLAVAPQGLHAAPPEERLTDPHLEARAIALGQSLRCLVCQNQSIEDSEAPMAHDLRLFVRERLAAGDSDEVAESQLVARYGDYIRLKPPVTPRTLLLWFGPLGALGFSLIATVGFLKKIRRSPPETLTPLEQKHLTEILAGEERK